LGSKWTCHLYKSSKAVIEVLAIDILTLFFNWHNSHVHKIRTRALGKMTNSNLVDLFVGLNSGHKPDYGSKTRKRMNNDIKECSFDVTSAPSLVAMLSRWSICKLPNRLVPNCRIIIWLDGPCLWKTDASNKLNNVNIRHNDMGGWSWSLKNASCNRSVS
jgi:hypothetical protein